MTVLVTGGAGYVGMNVVEALLARKDQVVLLDAGVLPAAIKTALAPYGALVEVITADIRDAAAVGRAFAQRRIDGVIHCAALTAGAEFAARPPRDGRGHSDIAAARGAARLGLQPRCRRGSHHAARCEGCAARGLQLERGRRVGRGRSLVCAFEGRQSALRIPDRRER